MPIVYVDKPRDKIIRTRYGEMLLKWEPDFAKRWNNKYYKAQQHIDSVVLYGCEDFIPVDRGDLIRSGREATRIGSGWVVWNSKHSRPVYYGRRAPGRKGPKVTRPAKWFDKWKTYHKDQAVNETIDKVTKNG